MSLFSYFRYAAVSSGCVLLVALGVAAVKLLPFVQNAGGALSLVGPLVAAAFATVFEVSVLFGTPIGFAWAAAIIAPLGQTASVTGSDLDWRLLRGVFAAGVLWAAVTAGLGGVANVELAAPGRVANNLLGTAREACTASHVTKTVTIPVLGIRWRCSDSRPPTLMGEFSRSNSIVSYSATSMSVSDDMTYVELNGLKLSSPSVVGRPTLRLAVDGAKLRGVWPLVRPVKLGEWGRALCVSLTASLLGLVSVWLVRFCRSATFWARVYGLLIALSSWLTLLLVDGRDIAGLVRYSLVPIAGCLMAGMLLLLLRLKNESKLRERVVLYRKQLDSSPS